MPKIDIAAERKAQIVQATIACIASHGYHHFSMQDVARRADISKGIIHYYFLNKEDLMLAVLGHVSAKIREQIDAAIAAYTTPTDKMNAFLETCFSVIEKTREYYQVSIDFWSQVHQKSAVRNLIAQHLESLEATGACLIRAGQADGSMRCRDPEAVSRWVLAMVDGLSLHLILTGSQSGFEQSRRLATAHILALLAEGRLPETASS